MKNEKTVRHEMMDKVRSELKTLNGRHTCLYRLIFDDVETDKRDMYIQALLKKDYIFGLENLYVRLAQLLRLKDSRSEQEEKFLAFVKKNKLI